MDAVTGSWSGVVEVCLYQCHIRASSSVFLLFFSVVYLCKEIN